VLILDELTSGEFGLPRFFVIIFHNIFYLTNVFNFYVHVKNITLKVETVFRQVIKHVNRVKKNCTRHRK